jgi:hypothetical protein
MTEHPPRRAFLLHLGGFLTLLGVGATPALAETRGAAVGGDPHPTPRPGITAAKVPTAEQLAGTPKVIDVFDQVREIPEVVDGIRCNCGCVGQQGMYSLLSCYESMDAMAIHCEICQAHGRLVHRMHAAGRTLDEIRRGVDARFT